MRKLSIEKAKLEIEKSPAASAKTPLPELWEKVRPFVLMVGSLPFIGKKVRTYIKAFVAAIDAIVDKDA